MNLSLAQAEKMIAAAKAKAAEIDTKMNISVVDAGANLVAFARMDGAWLGSVDISMKKARTARFFRYEYRLHRRTIATGGRAVQY